jgi:RNA polymerase sigma factor (sigma-70 family)
MMLLELGGRLDLPQREANNPVVPHRLFDVEVERRPMSRAGTVSAGTRLEESEAGRVAAFQRLADLRLDASYRLANAILGDESQSQDAVHDAVVLAWQRWSSLRDRTRFDAWFDRIIVNVCRDRLRQASRRPTTDIATASLSTSDATADVHRRLLVEQAFARLKPDDVVVLALRHFLDLELADIAVLLDVPLQTVNTRLRSARSRLRDLLEQSPRQVSR